MEQIRCYCRCKDTNFKANHNGCEEFFYCTGVVIADAKILILKQITTSSPIRRNGRRCYCRCKDTNFKANHNSGVVVVFPLPVVIADAKILILKQITTVDNILRIHHCCYCRCKDTNFKANHNLLQFACFALWLLLQMQRY